jgi:hypothetical protein
MIWLAAMIAFGYRVHRSVYAMPALYDPEQWLETLSAISWLAAAGLFLRVAWDARQNKHGRTSSILVAATMATGLVCLLCPGEELSWGQHAIGYRSPPAVAAINVQGEVNLHNLLARDALDATQSLVILLLLMAALVVLAARCLVRTNNRKLESLQQCSGVLVLLCLAAYANARLHIEVAEFVLPLAAVVSALQLGRLRGSGQARLLMAGIKDS